MQYRDQIQLENLYFSIHRKESFTEGIMRDVAHMALDIAGLFPGAGEFADIANAVIYLSEKEYLNAALSLISCIPVIGDAIGKGGKIAAWLSKLGKAGNAITKGVTTVSPQIRKVKSLIKSNKKHIDAVMETANKNPKLAPHVEQMKRALKAFAS